MPEPTRFSPSDAAKCNTFSGYCDRYQLLPINVGDAPSIGPITVTDKLPPGLTTARAPISEGYNGVAGWWACTEGAGYSEVTCTSEESVPAGWDAPPITVFVTAPAESALGKSIKNEVSITGGGTAAVASTSEETLVSLELPPFGLEFGFETSAADGTGSVHAGAHPWQVTASLEIPTVNRPVPSKVGTVFSPVENWKSAVVELPVGFLGDPQAAAECPETKLEREQCPTASTVGSLAVGAEGTSDGFGISHTLVTSPIYNMLPEGGYPAELGFLADGAAVYLYASVVRTPSGYRVRIASPGLPDALGPFGGVFTFYGEPAKVEGGSSEAAFLTNPAHCTSEPQTARAEAESWENPGHTVSAEATAYPQLTGCDLLQPFSPSLALAPSAAPEGTTQADEPSGYSLDLKLPQTEAFSETATPELKDATVTLPEGVSVSPSAADGLVGCPAEGPEGINIGSGDIGALGRDLGDPEATEFGAGHAGGNGSRYDDGVYHTAPGRCPEASTLGTVEVFTPVLATRCGGAGQAACKAGESPAPLQGRVYLAQPECGGAGQAECSDVYAEGRGGANGEGRLYGLYIEVEGDGVIVKLPGTVSADPATGRLKATFKENPQLPFSELKLRLAGGPRAPLANPQACGSFATSSELSSWAGQETLVPSPPFSVDWDGAGGACPAGLPFSPTFTAGTTAPSAGAFSPFTATFSRRDREQNLSALTLQTPPGLLGMLARVPLCPEPQAGEGTCGEASLIGHSDVAVGAGSHPFWVAGGVYLTGPYGGAPFGLSVVTPARAGPFNLGEVIVRAAIHVDPNTSALTVVSDPLPRIIDGVPLRIQTVNVTVDRPGFIFNPTDCSRLQVTATIASTQGASANVSSPFAVAGCRGLPFKPTFSVSTRAGLPRVDGTSLHVVVASTPGQANIASVHVELPKRLPSKLSTLRKACPEAVFAADPASCPPGSDIGTASAATPVLNVPLTGPVYLVSHGGAQFPDLVVVLQGQGVTIDLTGATHIAGEVTSSTFRALPDAPISRFEMLLPQGPGSVLATHGNLCSKPLVMPTVITGQNGARIKRSTRIAVAGCPHKHKHKRRTKTKKRRR